MSMQPTCADPLVSAVAGGQILNVTIPVAGYGAPDALDHDEMMMLRDLLAKLGGRNADVKLPGWRFHGVWGGAKLEMGEDARNWDIVLQVQL